MRHLVTQGHQHIVEDRITEIANPAIADLYRHVPVAQMIGGAGEQAGIIVEHRRYRFLGGNDPDYAGVCRAQQVAVSQHRATRQHQAGLGPGAVQHNPEARFPGVFRTAASRNHSPSTSLQRVRCSASGAQSEQEITLRQRQNIRRFTGQQLPVGPHLIGLRVNFDKRLIIVVQHVRFADGTGAAHRQQALFEIQRLFDAAVEGGL